MVKKFKGLTQLRQIFVDQFMGAKILMLFPYQCDIGKYTLKHCGVGIETRQMRQLQNQSFHAGMIKFFAFMTHIDLEKYLERFFRFKKKLVKANIFIPWVELVQSNRRGDKG
jgi:hypothetical protein